MWKLNWDEAHKQLPEDNRNVLGIRNNGEVVQVYFDSCDRVFTSRALYRHGRHIVPRRMDHETANENKERCLHIRTSPALARQAVELAMRTT